MQFAGMFEVYARTIGHGENCASALQHEGYPWHVLSA